jgi:oligosaccharide repeat unit polymerase wzy
MNAYSLLVGTLVFVFFYLTKEKKIGLYALMPYSAALFSSLILYLTYHFSWTSPFYVKINQFITGRLALGKNAFNLYELNWFGTRGVQFIGSGGSTESVLSYNYVDSSYVQMLFTYGIIPVLALILIYVLVSRDEFKKGRYLYVAILSLITVNCMIEAFWFVPSYNIFMFILFTRNTVDVNSSTTVGEPALS